MRYDFGDGVCPRCTAMLMRLVLLAIAMVTGFGTAAAAQAADYQPLPVVKPVRGCDTLASEKLDGVAGAPVTIDAAVQVATEKGPFCKVTGTIAPSIRFEVDLPVEKWTQRYVVGGCGGMCGTMPSGLSYVANCVPATNGELALSGNDMGHQSAMGAPDQTAFGLDPQKRIDFAYRANHVTTLVSKALIRAFYGQAPKYSYFVGCSDGGREALMEAQRYPDDFDGITAGDPAAYLSIQNTMSGAWMRQANTRADGSTILLAPKARLIHAAVVAQCDTLSGVKDGILADPRACRFDPATLKCPAGSSDTSQCLTDEEATAIARLYSGALDEAGTPIAFGYQRGSELQLHLPETNDPRRPAGGGGGFGVDATQNLYLPIGATFDGSKPMAFTQEMFARMGEYAPLYNATNTNLKPFAASGGKLILWHGWSDTSIPPGIAIAYYQGVRKFMGAAATDQFMRLFMMPGVAHCEGGDGNDKIDWLTPLMAWVELGRAPTQVMSGKTAETRGPGGGGPPGPRPRTPYPAPTAAIVKSRPIYAYPMVAKYTGKGDPNDAANYAPVRSPVAGEQQFGPAIARMIAPDNQKTYVAQGGKLVVAGN